MRTKSINTNCLQTQLYFPKNQLEQFLYHLQKMDELALYASLDPNLPVKGSKVEKVLEELLDFIRFERSVFNTSYLILQRGSCASGSSPDAGKQAYHLISGNPDSKHTFSVLIHHVHGNIKDIDSCMDRMIEGEGIDPKPAPSIHRKTTDFLKRWHGNIDRTISVSR
jgi:hypothetical protein